MAAPSNEEEEEELEQQPTRLYPSTVEALEERFPHAGNDSERIRMAVHFAIEECPRRSRES